MTPSSRPSGPCQDRSDHVGADIETDLVDLGCVGFGDIAQVDRAVLAHARQAILHDIEFPDCAVARFDPGRDVYDSAHARADSNAGD